MVNSTIWSQAKENNKPLKAECKQICEQTGALLHPVDDISTYVEVFGQANVVGESVTIASETEDVD